MMSRHGRDGRRANREGGADRVSRRLATSIASARWPSGTLPPTSGNGSHTYPVRDTDG